MKKRLSVLVWIGYAWLLGMTPFMAWTAWTRYTLRSELDASTKGYVVSEHRTSGRSASHSVVVGYTVGGHIFSIGGSAKEVGLDHASGQLEGRHVPVYYNTANPARSSLSRGARYEEVSMFAGLLVLALLVATYRLLIRWWRLRRSVIPEATVVSDSA